MALTAIEVPPSGQDVTRGITDRIAALNQSVAIPATNFLPKEPGLYEVFAYYICTTSEIGGGTIDFMLTHTDEAGTEEIDFGGLSLATLGRQTAIFLTRNITPVMSFRILLTGTQTTSRYSLYIVVRKV